MKIFSKKFKMSMSIVVFSILVILLVIVGILYWRENNPSSNWGAILGSLIAGILVAIIQFLISWQDFRETEKLKELKLVEVLYNRRTKEQYCEYIKSTTRKLDVMGSTAVRLFRDFADTTKGAPENTRVLLLAMDRGVKVRILLPSEEFLPNDEKRQDAKEVKARRNEINHENLEIRYFEHKAAHSIFRIDDTCIIGPIFPDIESRNTPALHVMNSSPMAINYLDYFDSEWDQAKEAEHA